MGTLRDKTTGETYEVSDAEAVAAARDNPNLEIAGSIRVSPTEAVREGDTLVDDTWSQAAVTKDTEGHWHQKHEEAVHDNALSTLKASGGALADTLSLGLVSPWDEDRQHHDVASGIGTGLGVLGTLLVPGAGETAAGRLGLAGRLIEHTPLGAVTKLGERAGSIVTRGGSGFLRSALGGAIEGGVQGAGQAIEELATSDKPLDIEHIGASLGSNVLFGGFAGAAAGTAARGLELGLGRAKRQLDELANAGQVGALGEVGGDLARLDRKGLRAARDAEVETLHGQQVAERASAKSSAVDEVLAYRAQVKKANPWLVIDEGENAARLNKSSRSFRTALDDPKGLRENPTSLLKPLRHEEMALEGALAKREAIAAKLEATNQRIAKDLGDELATLPDAATHVELSGKTARRYGAYADVRVGKAATVSVAREDAQLFLEALQRGEVGGASKAALDKLGGLLEQNRGLQAKIKQATAPLVAKGELKSARLAQIADALDAAGSAKPQPGVGGMLRDVAFGHMLGAAAGVPVLGSIAAAGRVALPLLKKLVAGSAENAARTSKAIGAFLDGTKSLAPRAPLAASKILASVKYSHERAEQREEKGKKLRAPSLAEAYSARASELRDAVELTSNGAVQMRADVRRRIADRLSPLRAASPLMADRLESLAARRVEFLASRLPRKPDLPGMSPDDGWHPSDMQMRGFARYVAAAEDPHGVVERLASGQVTSEDAETMRTVYPEIYADVQREIMMQMGELRAKLPYQRRLALSIFSGVPVDPVLDPRVLAALQGTFAAEEGTEQGTQAPVAEPQFGSVSREPFTPAQERGGGGL